MGELSDPAIVVADTSRPYRAPLRERFRVWWRNLPSTHHRIMARYLRKRGWVAFYLDEDARRCDLGHATVCWLDLYQQGERRRDA